MCPGPFCSYAGTSFLLFICCCSVFFEKWLSTTGPQFCLLYPLPISLRIACMAWLWHQMFSIVSLPLLLVLRSCLFPGGRPPLLCPTAPSSHVSRRLCPTCIAVPASGTCGMLCPSGVFARSCLIAATRIAHCFLEGSLHAQAVVA